MSPEDYIYNQIYKGALSVGASEQFAKDNAVTGLSDWKKGKFKKVIDLIEEKIKQAKKMTGGKNGRRR